MLLAFSLQSDIKSIGAYAGFAAIIGLALLVLLYFAHAREMRRMSEWLEQQEERLRTMPARMPQPRPLATTVTPATRVVPAQVPAAADAAAAPSATVAVPGARRVSVGAGGAVVAVAPDAAAGEAAPPQAATGDTIPPQAPTDEPSTTSLAGAVAAATVAGALIGGGGAVAKPPLDEDATAVAHPGSGVGAAEPGSAERPSAGLAGDRDRDRAPGAEPDGASDQPSGAVPLSARPPATAEPAGVAQTFGLPAEPGSRSGDAPDTSENAVVAPFDPGSGVVAVAPDPDAAAPFDAAVGGVAPAEAPSALVSPFEQAPSAEISAERLPASPFDFAVHEADVFGGAPEHSAEPADGDGALDGDGAPLGPSTAAGGRPRFPPAPEDARATPVGVSGRAGAAAVGVPLADGATTRRGGGERQPPGGYDDDDYQGGRGSVLRLLAAAIVIVAVLIFIATRVFGNSASNPPSSSSSKTGSSQSAGAPSPSSVTVAVLNGTHTSGLAARAATALAHLGFKKGTVSNALSRGHHATLVGYTPGNRAAAEEVAKDLAPTPTRVGPLDSRTAALTLTQSGIAAAVVVTLGSDYTGG